MRAAFNLALARKGGEAAVQLAEVAAAGGRGGGQAKSGEAMPTEGSPQGSADSRQKISGGTAYEPGLGEGTRPVDGILAGAASHDTGPVLREGRLKGDKAGPRW